MATAHIRGTARILYTHPSTGATTHLLALPLSPVRELLPNWSRERHDWFAGNKKARETVTLADGVDEATVTIRMDNEPTALREMLRVALENAVTLNYEPVADGASYPVQVVQIIGAGRDDVPIKPDRDRYGFGEWEVTILIRRVDGESLAGIFS